MNVTEEVLLTDTIFLANQISSYLLKTNRVLKAIELSKEQLFLLGHKTLKNAEQELLVIRKLEAYAKIFVGYSLTNQTRLAIDSGRKFLDLTRQNNLREIEGIVSLALAHCYEKYYDYDEAIVASILERLGEHVTAKEYGEKAIAIAQKIGKKTLIESFCYRELALISRRHREYVKAKEYQEKALEIAQEIGDREQEARCYLLEARMSDNDHEYVKAKEFQAKALAIAQEIGDKETEAECYERLGSSFIHSWVPVQDLVKAKHYFERALVLRRETGDMRMEAIVHLHISAICFLQRNFPEAKLHFSARIKQREVVRSFLKDHDQSKISYFDAHSTLFQLASFMLCSCFAVMGILMKVFIQRRLEEPEPWRT